MDVGCVLLVFYVDLLPGYRHGWCLIIVSCWLVARLQMWVVPDQCIMWTDCHVTDLSGAWSLLYVDRLWTWVVPDQCIMWTGCQVMDVGGAWLVYHVDWLPGYGCGWCLISVLFWLVARLRTWVVPDQWCAAHHARLPFLPDSQRLLQCEFSTHSLQAFIKNVYQVPTTLSNSWRLKTPFRN